MSKEQEIAFALGEVWNKFRDLEKIDTDDLNDFRKGIHDLQRIVSTMYLERNDPKFFGK